MNPLLRVIEGDATRGAEARIPEPEAVSIGAEVVERVAAGFRERQIGVSQILLTKPNCRRLPIL